MQTKFLGQGSGRAVANQTIGKREHRLTSLTCLLLVSGERYLRPNLPDSNREQTEQKEIHVSRLLNYRHLISLNEEGNFRFYDFLWRGDERVLDATCKQS